MAKKKKASAQEKTTPSASSGRSRTIDRRKAREHQRRRNRQLTLAVALVLGAVFIFILIIVASQPAEAPVSEGLVDRYVDIAQSVTDDGFPRLGDVEAPVRVVEYSSFDCSHCAEFHDTVTNVLVDRAEAGEITFTYVPLYGTGSLQNGEGAARAAICAGDQGRFWEMHDVLFEWHRAYGNNAFVTNRLNGAAEALGLDVGEWQSCFRSDATNAVLNLALQSTTTVQGFSGTPTVTVNGVLTSPTLEAINTAINEALRLAGSRVTPEPDETEEPDADVTDEAEMEETEAPDTDVTAEAEDADMTQEPDADATSEADDE